MSFDLLIPFAILITLVVYLIYSRTKFEKEIVNIYEEKFDEWKSTSETTNKNEEKRACKELVALVFKEDHSVSIELLDDSVTSALQRGKFKIKAK